MRRAFLIGIVAFIGLGAAPAVAAEFTCPEDLNVDQTVSRKPQGWLSLTLTTNIPQSDQLIVFDGTPEEMASLVPDNEGAAGESPYWTFPAEKPRRIWVQCDYAGQASHFARALPDDITKCTQSAGRTLSCE